MRLFRSIRPQIIALTAVPLVMLVAIAVTVSWLHAQAVVLTNSSLRAASVLQIANRVESLELVADGSAGEFIAMRRAAGRGHFNTSRAAVLAAFARLEGSTRGRADEAAVVRTIGDGLARRLRVLSSGVERELRGEHSAALAALSFKNSIPSFLVFRDGVEKLDALERSRRTVAERSFMNRMNQAYVAIMAATIVACVIIIGLAALLGLRLAERMHRITRRAEAYAASGEILHEFGGDDEIARIDRAFTELAHAVDRRETLLKRYQLLAETASDAILFIDDKTDTIVEVNSAAAAMYGYTREAMIGMPAKTIRRGAPVTSGEITGIRRDGTEIPLDVRSAYSRLPSGTMRLSIARDATERRHNEAATRAALAQAVEASRLKSEFVSTMSHEIRTPMNAVIGMSELLLETPLSPEQQEYVRILRSSGQSLLSVINDILDFSKIEAGHMDLSFEEFSLLAVVEDAAAIVAGTARKKRLELMTFVDPEIPRSLIGDSDRLRQILVNLIGNAVKFTEAGSVIVNAALTGRKDGDATIAFEVRDTGIGMDEAQIGRLFQAFRQADGSTTRRFGGSGLGLAISQRLTKLMGGRIEVQSRPGEGSRFAFTLTMQAGSGRHVTADTAAAPPMRVLVVDDDATARNILKRYLGSWGIDHHAVSTGAEATATVHAAVESAQPYTIALIDLRLREESGFELAARLRQSTHPPALVMITAYDASHQGRRALDAGFAAYLLKPIRQSQLYDVLVRIASGAPSQDTTLEQRGALVAPMSSTARILIAEDNEINQRLAVRQLQLLGYDDVTVASDGAEALAILENTSFDLILMDVHMPKLDGFQTARAIRRSETGGARIPIVAMTANALAQDREECLAAGMDDHIGKPVSMAALRDKLAKWLGDPSADGALPVLDIERLTDIFGEDTAQMRSLLAMAQRSLGELVGKLEAASGAEAVQYAHDIKGAAANIGAVELSARASEIEARIANGGRLNGSVSAIRAAYRRLAEAIQAEAVS